MTVKGYVCALALAGAMLGGCAQNSMAMQVRSDTIAIAHSFKVNGAALPAGSYRLEEMSGNGVWQLVNTETGRAVVVLRSNSTRKPGKVAFIFHETAQGVTLAFV